VKQEVARHIIDCLTLSGGRGDLSPLARLSQRRWEQAIQWLDNGGLTLFWWNRCKTSGNEGLVPAEFRAQLDRNLLDNASRAAGMAEEFNSINCCFDDFGVRYVAFKGLTLIPAYCPDASLRTTYDYDYLLPPDSMPRADEALISVGYHRSPEPATHHVVYAPVARTACLPASRDRLFSRQFRRKVELHTRLWSFGSLGIKMALPQNPWERRYLRTWRDVRFYGLGGEEELAYQVLHVFYQILSNWCRLGWLFDVAYFLNQRGGDSAFWERFCGYVGDYPPLARVAGVVFRLAADLFGAAVPGTVERGILRSLPDSLTLWVEQYGRNSALKNFAEDKHSPLFLQREFVGIEEEAAWRNALKRRLLPLHAPNRRSRDPNRGFSADLEASWKQAVYIAKRLVHHLKAPVVYGWHSHRWKRMRGKKRGTGS
jgi:hypothetical protein